jgi:dihydrofolate reductase
VTVLVAGRLLFGCPTICGRGTVARLLYSATMSLDGYIAGPGGDMSWLAEHLGGENPTADRLLASVGALLVGNTTFGGDDPNRGTDREGAFGGAYQGPVFVLTHRPPEDPPEGVTFVGDLHEGVARAEDAAGDTYVNVLGADVATQCIEAGLLDEVLVFIAPVLLGDGVPLFRRPGGTRVRLTPMPDETAHWYSVVY